jgi:acetyl esterase
MPYAPDIEEFADRSNKAMPPDFYLHPVEEQRVLYEGLTEEFRYEIPADTVVTNDTVSHDGRTVLVRIYRPLAPLLRRRLRPAGTPDDAQ